MIWYALWEYVIKTVGLFISFLPKVVQSWETKTCENEKFCIFKDHYLPQKHVH